MTAASRGSAAGPPHHTLDTSATARWRNPDGTTEEASFITVEGDRLFAITHLPAGPPTGAVLVCSPVMLELMRNYRREVVLARTLASRGVAVLRFHYRGSGHSDGHPSRVTTASMIADARAAAGTLCAAAGTDRVGHVGTRVGSLVAAAASAGSAGAPLVLWEPVVDPRAYARELFRAQLVGGLKRGSDTADPEAELRHNGHVEILGFRLERTFLDGLATVDLTTILSHHDGPLLIGEASRSGSPSRRATQLVGRLRAAGRQVDHTVVRDETSGWWFPGALSSTDVDGDLFVTEIATWITSRSGAAATTAAVTVR